MKKDEEIFELADEGKSYIEIDDEFRLLMSPRNWQLQKKIIAKSDTDSQKAGDVSWASFNWFMTLESALKTILHIKVSKTKFNDVQSFLKANEKAIKELSAALSPEYKTIKD